MNLPPRYNQVRAALKLGEVSYGSGGIKLLGADEIERRQIGYSVAPDGKSLCSRAHGAWRSNWIVIGHETACGDPIFVDTDEPTLPVFTALHGESAWEPQPVAISIAVFARAFEELARTAKGRSNPLERENNPLSDSERDAFLRRVAELNDGQFEPDFWAALLES